jgi:hypothetical protein
VLIDGGTLRHEWQLSHWTHWYSTFTTLPFFFAALADFSLRALDEGVLAGFFFFFGRFAVLGAAGAAAAAAADPDDDAPAPIAGGARRAVLSARFRFTPFAASLAACAFFSIFVYDFSVVAQESVHHVASSHTHWSDKRSASTDAGSGLHFAHCSHCAHSSSFIF